MNKCWLVAFCCVIWCCPLLAAKVDMTYEQYETELASLQQREKSAKEQIAQEQARIESLKQQIAEIEQRIIAVKAEIYRILGISEADVAAAETELASIRQQLEILFGLSVEDLKKRLKDVDLQQSRIAAFKKKPVSYLWRVRDQIPPLEQLLSQVREKAALKAATVSKSADTYTVRLIPGKRDCLFRIAAYDYVYNDPTKWPLLYRSNESIIRKHYKKYAKNASQSKYSRPEDLIFPGQVLDIPR